MFRISGEITYIFVMGKYRTKLHIHTLRKVDFGCCKFRKRVGSFARQKQSVNGWHLIIIIIFIFIHS